MILFLVVSWITGKYCLSQINRGLWCIFPKEKYPDFLTAPLPSSAHALNWNLMVNIFLGRMVSWNWRSLSSTLFIWVFLLFWGRRAQNMAADGGGTECHLMEPTGVWPHQNIISVTGHSAQCCQCVERQGTAASLTHMYLLMLNLQRPAYTWRV